MPLKPFQRNYWVTSSTAAPAPTPTGKGGYPGWQTSVVGTLWGALWELAVTYWGRLLWWMTTVRRLWALHPDTIDEALREAEHPSPAPPPIVHYVNVPTPAPAPKARQKAPRTRVGALLESARRLHRLPDVQQEVVKRVLGLLEDPRYDLATTAVRHTATLPGFHRPEAWRSLTHLLKGDPGRAENMYRRVKATEQVKTLAREMGSTVTNPQAQLLVELAYHAYTITGRR